VLTQARRLNGVANQTTSFSWLTDGAADLKVTYPNGDVQRFAHEQPQVATAAGMDPPGAGENRLSAVYNINATVKPATVIYDPATKFVTQRCDGEGTPGALRRPPARAAAATSTTRTSTSRASPAATTPARRSASTSSTSSSSRATSTAPPR
jgi:hypothetical protein